MIRVLVVDDHVMVREGLASVLAADGDIEVVAAAANGAKPSRSSPRTRRTSS